MLSQGRLVLVVYRRGSVSGAGPAGGRQESVQSRTLGWGQFLCFQQLPESGATGGQPGDHFLKQVAQREVRQGQPQRFQDAHQDCAANFFAGPACFLIVGSVSHSSLGLVVRTGHC